MTRQQRAATGTVAVYSSHGAAARQHVTPGQ